MPNTETIGQTLSYNFSHLALKLGSLWLALTLGLTLSLPLTASATQVISMSTNPEQQHVEQLYSHQPSVTPELAIAGELPVGVKTIEIDGPNLLNKQNGRRLKLEIWYPAKRPEGEQYTGKATYSDVTRAKKAFTIQGAAYREATPLSSSKQYPLVILSHGYTGYRSLMFYLGEHLASHGYVVASIDHTDSTNAEVDFLTDPNSGFQSTLLHRSRDQLAALNHISEHANAYGANPDLASVIGYSMGGFGALNTVGACHYFPDSIAGNFNLDPVKQASIMKLLNNCSAGQDITSQGATNQNAVNQSAADPRWKAMVALAPWGGEMGVITHLDKINVPSLLIAGADDDISGYENGVKKLFEQTGAEHKYLMVYEGARHNIAPHPAPRIAYGDDLSLGHYFEPAWSSESLNRINQHMILAFLNCHVKGAQDSEANQTACSMLPTRTNITQEKQADGKLNAPWPGFKDRFGTGVKFYRGSGVGKIEE